MKLQILLHGHTSGFRTQLNGENVEVTASFYPCTGLYFHILLAYLVIRARFGLIQSYLKDFMWKYAALLKIKAL